MRYIRSISSRFRLKGRFSLGYYFVKQRTEILNKKHCQRNSLDSARLPWLLGVYLL